MNQKSFDKNKALIEFSITDSGIGIPATKLGVLFQSFSQVDDSTTRRFGGSGLGLAISKTLVEKMGGTIGVNSVINEGSTFFFSILAGIEVERRSPEVQVTECADYDKSISVLVAEDNPTNQKLVCRFFDKIGVKITLANDGLEVLELIKINQFDLIFMDVQMPNMDGMTATREVIKVLGKDAPPIIAMTANVFKEDQDKCYEAGMVDFLGKPISRKGIIEILCKYHPMNNVVVSDENTMESSTMCLIDKKQILFEFAEDFDIFCELVDDYKAGCDKMLNDLHHAIDAGESANVKIVAHTMKGITSNFYAKELVEDAFTLEEMGERDDLINASESLEKLKVSNNKVLKELDSFIKKHNASLNGEVA
jgi:CheY-like chemotaxis protein